MSDLIERQKAIDAVLDLSEKSADEMLFIDAIVDEIENLPSAEPERKKGAWIWKLADNGWADHICPVCGWTKNTDIHVSLGYNFCPNCGAEMTRGE